jgi:ribonuclease E
MSKKMLIDAGHPEETRVVVVDGTRVEDFDFEAAARRPIRGNIYLAKVTRVEPSLQAAFVEYGGNRHGFLAFNEIHPDYYQIPYEDRVALAEEEASAAAEDAAEEDEAVVETSDAAAKASDADTDDESEDDAPEAAEAIGGDDDDDDFDEEKAARRRKQLYRRYKIQEVIKRRQILLVQVAKEERGNKGAALTTYLSLAGRYCVLMPNTPRGGGISRKISNAADRKRLKTVVNELELPKGVGLIIRTAGAKRTKTEIRRDADYLTRLWENIRELTLGSVAPTLIYEEGNLVKRAIRDLYDKEIDSVQVEGEAAYKEAKAFMRMLMPSHAKKVQHHKDAAPLYLRHQIEPQLEAIYSPIVPLKSGGYLVINPTEALVSIDVNSGRATRERNIEATALKTNSEAAVEAARQMRLRDLAGLVVIDFIDMDESKNNRAVEKKMKDALKRDRARLQVGRISQFGLMELSRQRRRSSLIEGSTTACPTCEGAGYVRSVESSALVALRALEKEGLKGRCIQAKISVPTAVALYMLNDKREHLLSIEARFQMAITVGSDNQLVAPACTIEAIETREAGQELVFAPLAAESDDELDTIIEEEDDGEAEAVATTETDSGEQGQEGSGRRRRRRRRRKGGSSGEESTSGTGETSEDDTASESTPAQTTSAEGDGEDAPRKRRRRGRRGGRGRRRTEPGTETAAEVTESTVITPEDGSAPATPAEMVAAEPETAETSDEKPKRKRAPRRRKTADAEVAAEADVATTEATDASAEPVAAEAETEEKPKRRARRPRKKATETPAAEADVKTEAEGKAVTEDKATPEPAAETVKEKPKRKRAPRRKKADAEPAKAESAETAAPAEAEAKATETPKPKRSKAKEPAAADAGAEDEAKPRRKGWWSKTGLFGG